jgi:2-oxoglutarate dehydrogenase E2 component (dihydrolipoamide succinyltransferase)
MSLELKVPEVGESITEAQIASWLKAEGEAFAKDEPLVEIETDKITLEVPAPAAGVLTKIVKPAGEMATVGEVIAVLTEGEGAPVSTEASSSAASTDNGEAGTASSEAKTSTPPAPESPPAAPAKEASSDEVIVMPAAQRVLDDFGMKADGIPATGPGGRLLKEDVVRFIRSQASSGEAGQRPAAPEREDDRVPLSPMRKRIAARLVEAQQQAALLTTFNEIDMSAVMTMRKAHRDEFEKRHDVRLGFTSFFVKAAAEALARIPAVNASIEGDHVIYRNYADIGIAVSSDKGLVVPILRSADQMTFPEIERAVADFAARARSNKLSLDELQGGTFTISNGGVFGSLLSTPIVNPPQTGILGLHAIQERPVARDGEVVIRPMMYVALSYDHRLVDGRDSVTFLKTIKELVEDPTRLLLEH